MRADKQSEGNKMGYFTEEEWDNYNKFRWKEFKLVAPICLLILALAAPFIIFQNRTAITVDSHSWRIYCLIYDKNGAYLRDETSTGEGLDVIPPQFELTNGEYAETSEIYNIYYHTPAGKESSFDVTEEQFYQLEDGKTYTVSVERGKITKIHGER